MRWEFVQASMAALERLRAALVEAEEEGQKGAMLSVKAEAAVSSLLQTSIALGMLPSLLPGVGLAPEKRSKWARVCMEGRKDENQSRCGFSSQVYLNYIDSILVLILQY